MRWEEKEGGDINAEEARSGGLREKRLKSVWYLLRSKSWKEDKIIFKLEPCWLKDESLKRTSLLYEMV